MTGCDTSSQKDNTCFPEIKVSKTTDEKEITFQEMAEDDNPVLMKVKLK